MAITKDFTDKVKLFAEDYPKSHSLNSLRNSFILLNKSKKFQGIDDNISIFCAITAEEEAVSSIFLALKQLGYNGSDKVNHYNHVHKAAFYPFCKALESSFEIFNKNSPQLVIDRSKKLPRLYIRFFVKDFNENEMTVTPDVPFGFILKNEISIEYFEENLKRYFGNEFEKLKGWLKNAANMRNKILYASPGGIPKITITEPERFFSEYEKKINSLMFLYFLIAPYKEKQLFVQQALNAFIKMIGKVPNEEKLLEMIEAADKEPVTLNLSLNECKMTGIKINDSNI